jgi:hypothetical protein
VYEDAARQWKHLCFVLEAAERSRENQPVVVTPKLRTVVVALSVFDFLSESLVGNELLPVHGRKGMKNMCTLARESKEKQVFLLLFPRLFVPLHIIL